MVDQIDRAFDKKWAVVTNTDRNVRHKYILFVSKLGRAFANRAVYPEHVDLSALVIGFAWSMLFVIGHETKNGHHCRSLATVSVWDFDLVFRSVRRPTD